MKSTRSHTRRLGGGLLIALGLTCSLFPLFAGNWAIALLGVALVAVGLVDLAQAVRGTTSQDLATNYASGAVSMVVGFLLFLQPQLVVSGLLTVVALGLAVDGAVKIAAAVRDRVLDGGGWRLFNGVVNLVLAGLVYWLPTATGMSLLGLFVGIYLLASGWSMLMSPSAVSTPDASSASDDRHPNAALGLPPHPTLGRLHRESVAVLQARRSIDLYWCLTLVLVFFAIHVGRLDSDWNAIGFISPGIAVVGDILTAILLTVTLILPARLTWRRLTRRIERMAWQRALSDTTPTSALPLGERLVRRWIEGRLRFSVRLNEARRSLANAAWLTLETGLPVIAVLVAVNPIWGFSWYFNTENWASAFWQKVAASRTDDWRAGMVDAVIQNQDEVALGDADLFAVHPPGVADSRDFSFLVIGDPGEGDASQHILRDRYLELAKQADVKFIIVSSDVVYPSGEMIDYEYKFYLPFKGVDKPIYAIPGNHDWFDALDGFTANFLEPATARIAMQARVDVDRGFTTTTPVRIDALIEQAAALRSQYGVRAALQRAPFFELHAPGFTLLAIDTGIMRTIDAKQREWLEAALSRSNGTFTMAIVGHPFYAGGAYQGDADEDFGELHTLLREHGVSLIMAGDTHDFEYYLEPPRANRTESPTHHFVIGGGGAYLSIGTALDWPASPPVADYAFYPSTQALTEKLDVQTPTWKWPIWWWLRKFHAWPTSVETLSGVFDFNRAPFFQSFMEVRVEESKNRIRLILHGSNGPLHWKDLQRGGHIVPESQGSDDVAEWIIPMSS